ncbi:signal recognition particle protein [Rickettsia endosymbiont of Cardiosporidium cionae]|uniref:signal recognition particle protein n=1 Tax=Rickettsia endosymbiont of Cardiosporidium cionae TaxID=2777155 RepID=UPI001895E60E|nr:signal recognition particle protein [Rickettsia endosymbiont of Cardiosporidium cionae]KAF8818220.1 signal recognition particle protein [Rickettsia endosymbiont of Cardiosporidium cionae]
MFSLLTNNINKVFDKIKRRGIINENHIDEIIGEIRSILLSSDVALDTVKEFISIIKDKAYGKKIIQSISPSNMIIKIIHDEMVNFLTPTEKSDSDYISVGKNNVMFVGLQGSGKTTSAAKLALKLKNDNKKILLVSLDVYRPAAQEQLGILAQSISVDSLEIVAGQNPISIAERALVKSRLEDYDTIIYDTAGRMHIDDEMIDEAVSLKKLLLPSEVFLVVDSMTGQDATNIARDFNDKLDITSVILSRIDGDAKGGAALSIRHVTGKAIKFLGTGEKLKDFENFEPKRIVSRILGMGDVVSLVESAEKAVEQDELQNTVSRMKHGKLDLNDYVSQIKMINNMGGISKILHMLPGINKISNNFSQNSEQKNLLSTHLVIVNSMTKKEKQNPNILNVSRKNRIASGSGTSVKEVNSLLKQFKKMQDITKKISKLDNKNTMQVDDIKKMFSNF